MTEGLQPGHGGTARRYEVFHTDCAARDTVDHVTSRWGVWVLIALQGDDLRFYELRDSIRGISEKMLAQTLRALVQDGLVWRTVEPTTPPQVTYGLTEFGRDVGEPLLDLFDRITRRLTPPGGSRAER
ncbi:winged helix-turn-helix transcriptional regulator [Kitasatospora aburaviensis]|uniref:Winged helix-turn-helix transcriptional regulator n=1 Tax=Kitasatospora aburaviensis TaxID=67265 RepID=A0ABW1F219_9ACTN